MPGLMVEGCGFRAALGCHRSGFPISGVLPRVQPVCAMVYLRRAASGTGGGVASGAPVYGCIGAGVAPSGDWGGGMG